MTRFLLIVFGLFLLVAIGFFVADHFLRLDCEEVGGLWDRRNFACEGGQR